MIAPDAKVEYDSAAGIIRCRFEGLLSMSIMEDFAKDFLSCVTLARRRSVSVRVLVDSAKAVVQTAEIIGEFQRMREVACRPGDRYAVVVESALLKMQASRAIDNREGDRLFSTLAEAETWLRS